MSSDLIFRINVAVIGDRYLAYIWQTGRFLPRFFKEHKA